MRTGAEKMLAGCKDLLVRYRDRMARRIFCVTPAVDQVGAHPGGRDQVRFIDRKVGLAIGAGVARLGLFGAVALAAFAPDAAPTAAPPVTADAQHLAANDVIAKALAEKKITDDQAKKLRDSVATRIPEFVDRKWPTKPAVAPGAGSDARGFLGDMTKAALDYLGLSKDQLGAAMRGGNSLAQIAVGQGKTRQGLYDGITSAAFKRVDEAQSAGKLTADQAKAAKDRIAIEVNTFIDRKPGATTSGGRPAIGKPPTVQRATTGTP